MLLSDDRKFSGRFQQDLDSASQRDSNGCHALSCNEPDLVLGETIRLDDHITRGRRSLRDLTCIGSQELIVKPAADKQKTPLRAPVFHLIGNRRLDVDFREYFDIVGIGDYEIPGRNDAAVRFVQKRRPVSAAARSVSLPAAS